MKLKNTDDIWLDCDVAISTIRNRMVTWDWDQIQLKAYAEIWMKVGVDLDALDLDIVEMEL